MVNRNGSRSTRPSGAATAQYRAESLDRARNGESFANWPVIIAGFVTKGIPESEIRPRENVLTFNAWRAVGRHVKRGEHGVRVVTYIPITETRNESGEITRAAGRRPWSAVVFHVNQTEPDAVSVVPS